jgi:hemerythrin-like domain-containing protein
MEKAEQLTDILKRHHQREEDVLFPELEKRGMYGPPMAMREEHKQLRPRKRELKKLAVELAGLAVADLAAPDVALSSLFV